MWNWLALPGTKKKEEKRNEGVYKEPAKASFKDPEFVKKVDTLIDSLNMPVSHYVPDFTALEPAVMRGGDKWQQQAYKKALIELLECYRNGWFDVCIIHNAEKAFGISRNDSRRLSTIYEKLSLVHCVHWKNMDPEIIEDIPKLLNEAFRLIEQLAYPNCHNAFDGSYSRRYDDPNVYYIEGNTLKQRED